MQWLALTLLAICSRATYGVATKVLSNVIALSAATQSVLLTATGAVLAIVISPFIGGISFAHITEHWLLIVAMILTQAIGNVVFFKGQPKLEASVTQITFSSILLWSVGFSMLFLGSHFSIKQFFGIALLLGAILLIQYKRNVRKLDSAALYILGAAALFALFQVTSAELAKSLSAATYLLLAYGGASLLIGVCYQGTVHRDIMALRKGLNRNLAAMLFAAGTSLLYFTFAYYAYKVAPDRGVVVVLLTAQVVLSVILGIVFLKERKDVPKKLTAGALAVVAGTLIKS